ncbi:YeeE/YedE family protein [Labrys monachus]|uniref:Membrane protein YedE/YeeE n=1 Tax=Labrys monachus TaxID=217067 RepID=A0ABU0FM44_9HYPH|nr:YeeE/YedE family protein [Labrys monachus]MDQ0395536.1 putative membrane protein YedE/YeeE [Labrys monachus]
MSAYWPSLLGGMLLGLSASLLLVLDGRIAGISGIVGRLLLGRRAALNAAFVAGLVAGPFAYAALFGALPALTVAAAWPVILAAGLLVGVGSRMGSGCTSGHGILGLARLSPRSIAATATFLAAGILTATLGGLLG